MVIDGFCGAQASSELRGQLSSLYSESGGTSEFRTGLIGGGADGDGADVRHNDSIRGDTPPPTPPIDPPPP